MTDGAFGSTIYTYAKQQGAAMKTAFLIFTGIVTTAFGVGGVENSVTNAELVQSLAVAITGLGIMYCGTLMAQREAQ